MPHQATFEQWVPFPLEEVFRFFADPHNLPCVMPSWMDVRIERESIINPPSVPQAAAPGATIAGAGSELEASYRALPFLPLRIRSVAVITAFAVNQFFEDIQGRGPFQSWHHRHEFQSEVRDGVPGTLIRDIVHYEIGFGFLGGLANALFVAPQMRRTFRHRQAVVQGLLTPKKASV